MAQTGSPITLVRATVLDIPFIMETERLPGYDRLVNRMPLEKHRAVFETPDMAYFLAIQEEEPVAFCLIHNFGGDHTTTTLRRAAVTKPNGGIGRALLGGLTHMIFRDTVANRVQLGVLEDNQRGIHTYQQIGFQAEGVSRGSVHFFGAYRNELIMAILRDEWQTHPFYQPMFEMA